MQELFKFLVENKDTANAIAAVASALVAAIAFVVSVAALCVAHSTLRHQRQHNRLSVTPIPEATVADYENSLRVKLRNHGSGPLIVVDLHVGDGSSTKRTLLDWMPDLPAGRYWTNYAGEICHRSILPGHEIPLIQLDGDPEDPEFADIRDACRLALSRLILKVEFTDVYGTDMKPYRKSLTWFTRHLTGQKTGQSGT